MNLKRLLFAAVFLLLLLPPTMARHLPPALERYVDSTMRAGLQKGYYPGASVAVGDRNGVLFEKCYGWQDAEKMNMVKPGDVYDIASCTKIVATTLAVMYLYDNSKIDVNKTVGDYIPDFRGTVVDKMTLSSLLTHTSGLGNIAVYRMLYRNECGDALTSTKCTPDYPLHVDVGTYLCRSMVPDPGYLSYVPQPGYRIVSPGLYVNPAVDTLVRGAIVESYRQANRGRYLYSDLNFHILQKIVERVSGESLDRYVRPLFDRMEMHNTGYLPLLWKPAAEIVPTENDLLMRRGMLRGYVHDELAAVNGGVGGNAGLFSNASDLSKYCEMILNNGVYRDDRILSAATVELFLSTPLRPKGIYRALGFDRRAPSSELYDGYGHTGYTGTMVWMDDRTGLFLVFLSNRVNPSRTNRGLITSNLRTDLWQRLVKYYGK